MPTPAYGSRLKMARTGAGLSLREAAGAAGMDPSLLSRIERGEVSDIGLSKAVALCAAYGITLEDLIGSQAPRKKAIKNRRTTKAKRLLEAAVAEIEAMEKDL